MILEPNVPKSVRTWAACQVEIRKLEHAIASLSLGKPTSLGQYGLLKKLGSEKFITQVAEPRLRLLKRRRGRYLAISEAIGSLAEPGKHLLGKSEMLELVGHTLHFTLHHTETFMTLQYCSPDGERVFGRATGNGDGMDQLELLSFGFGRA